MTRVLIIGAGASGMASAIFAARGGAAVTVLEQNEKPCRKLLATGNGRCNLTNLDQRPEYYRGNEPDFPWKVIQNFDVKETRKFFEELGIYIRSKGGYLYPYSEQAASVAEVLLMEAVRLKVKIKTLERVVCVKKTEYGFSAATQTWEYAADRLILACGSPASMIEGSCGDAIEFAKTFGHSSSEFLPALAGLRGSGLSFAKWAGVRMQGSAALFIENQKAAQETGELQFTDYGISGIPVFQLSRHAVKAVSEQKKVAISLDLMPAFTKEKLTAYLRERRLQNPEKNLEKSLIGLLPDKMIGMLCTKKSTPETIARDLKELTFDIKGASSLKQAQVCQGGIRTEQICPDSMESLRVPGLYFAGESVDVDGICGGYNLQWAWSSGAVAGSHAAKERI